MDLTLTLTLALDLRPFMYIAIFLFTTPVSFSVSGNVVHGLQGF
jgi:hypothetical protein